MTVCDDGTPMLCATGRVTVAVHPEAVADTATTREGTAVDVDIAANDNGIVGPATVTTAPSHGTVTISGDVATYTPAAGFSGTDTFEYTICADIAPDLCSTTTVTITVTAAPPEPEPSPTPTPTPTPAPTPPPVSPPAGDGGLPVTGTDPVLPGLAGLLLVAAGTALVLAVRRRRRA